MKNGSGPLSSVEGLTFQKGLRNVARYLRSSEAADLALECM